jgi:hypothetical protein
VDMREAMAWTKWPAQARMKSAARPIRATVNALTSEETRLNQVVSLYAVCCLFYIERVNWTHVLRGSKHRHLQEMGMNIRKSTILNASLVAVAAVATTIALAQQPAKDAKPAAKAPAGQPEMKLPPCVSMEDMMTCQTAGMPGKMHEWLAKGVGTWNNKDTFWMCPGADPMPSASTAKVTAIMDGRFIQVEHNGDMQGHPFIGNGVYGYDNVAQKFQGTWIDNCGSAIMPATGVLGADNKSITWTYTYTCPITKKQTTMRQVQKWVSENEQLMEMYAIDARTQKEFKMIESRMTRK